MSSDTLYFAYEGGTCQAGAKAIRIPSQSTWGITVFLNKEAIDHYTSDDPWTDCRASIDEAIMTSDTPPNETALEATP